MPPANRHEPRRAKSSQSDYSVTEFLREFPDDAACLEHLWRSRYSADEEHAECPKCERELGVHYKTAWRMFNKIRNELMKDDDEPLSGDVEIDETGVHGRPRGPKMTKREAAIWRRDNSVTVLGMVERGGRLKLRVIPSRRGPGLSQEVRANVNPSSIIITDDWQAYKPLRPEYLDHKIINHSAGSYVVGDIHTNSIEGAFGNLKTGMRGTYKKISRKWLQSYLDEYTYRYNERFRGERAMFHNLLDRTTK